MRRRSCRGFALLAWGFPSLCEAFCCELPWAREFLQRARFSGEFCGLAGWLFGRLLGLLGCLVVARGCLRLGVPVGWRYGLWPGCGVAGLAAALLLGDALLLCWFLPLPALSCPGRWDSLGCFLAWGVPAFP